MKKFRVVTFIFGCLLLGIGFIRAAQATTFSNRPMGEVVKEASLILRGRTGASQSDWGKGETKGSIFTYTDFEVSEVLKGASFIKAGDRIFLRQPGGEKDGIEMSVAATAHFAPGSDVVVTLAPKNAEDQSYDVLNLTAGKYEVVQENGQTYLVNGLSSGEIYNNHAHGGSQSYSSKLTIEDLRQIIAGQAPEKAAAPQFQSSKTPVAKPSVEAQKSANKPAPQVSEVPQVSEGEASSNYIWMFLVVIVLAVAIFLWKATSSKGGPDS